MLDLDFSGTEESIGAVIRGPDDETVGGSAAKGFHEAEHAVDGEGFVSMQVGAYRFEVVCRDRGESFVVEGHREAGSGARLPGGVRITGPGFERVDQGDTATGDMLDPAGGVEGALADESAIGGFLLRTGIAPRIGFFAGDLDDLAEGAGILLGFSRRPHPRFRSLRGPGDRSRDG